MPGPPPPPPPGIMPPPPPTPMTLPKAGKTDDRAALLKSIQKGARLKKAVTNDRSSPQIGGKPSNNTPNGSIPSNTSRSSPSSVTSTSNGLNLGGLFSGGMPKLKPTGKLGPVNQQNSTNNHNHVDQSTINRKPAVPTQQPMKNSSSLQNELRKQLASDNKNRGPPPPAPGRNPPEEYDTRQVPVQKIGSTNGVHKNQSSLHTLQPQSSTLHRKVKSDVNLSALDSSKTINGFNQNNKPVISHGKPNLAPKPPVLNAKPTAPPKKLIINGKPISRAHSMKSPRSPSPQSPDGVVPSQMKFGTVRNLSSVIGQSLANSNSNLSPRQRPALNGRPNAPPPSIPTQQPPPSPFQPPPQMQLPPPPSKTMGVVKPPNHAPPPPPSHTPPPPPHRAAPSRAPPAVPMNGSGAPPPPPRHSSMTSTRKVGLDLEEKYKGMFNDPSTFPRPPPFKNTFKLYGGKQAGSKQQAPQPPNFQPTNRAWDASSAC